MINVKYNQKGSCYIVSLSGIGDRIVTGKFDTGAVATIITSKKLGLTDKQVEALKEYFRSSETMPSIFHTVADEKIEGYLVRARNVNIYSVTLNDFYYYLVLDNSLDKALLGDDFISCCTFHHKPKGDIYITAVDMELYASAYEGDAECIDIAAIYTDISEGIDFHNA